MMSGASELEEPADIPQKPRLIAEHQHRHLLVLVHGILSGPSDWNYVVTELKKRLIGEFLIYASAANSFVQTLSGIDVAGRRLAEEVKEVIKKNPGLEQISFVGHSLGGLFVRYAIAVLLDPVEKESQTHETRNGATHARRIRGLTPVNLITLATPHLGVRGKKQLPFLFGVAFLEKLAAPLAPFLAGKTGRQLFLLDEKPLQPPLLLCMAEDHEDLHFLSALGSFKFRSCYSNVSYDYMVGWRTSSIRRETELPKPPKESIKGYKHVVGVTYCPPVHKSMPSFQSESAEAKDAVQKDSPSIMAVKYYYEKMEEEMIRGLQQVSWCKVDVSFHEALWPFLAHNHIHVKSQWLYYEGAGVVAHVADSLNQEGDPISIMANL
ncbi:hypothetical protein GOP47_0014381 [Adiantum capillus-veneris]|uniref:DUF676 domain-containing protein n=1 Tax=Adiantum capillus-veneris TaxID=13818 RepID=A0A9D4UMH4_ADICA|nr:hypothetical protein GOP47_0014381 [Adiantum capillus-veneris]